MTDTDLAVGIAQTQALETLARARWEWAAKEFNDPERDAALSVIRKSKELRVMLEQWVVMRATRAALKR